MDRPSPTLDQILQMARENVWDKLIWKPAYWHELDKQKYAKPRAYGNVLRWAVLTLYWPVSVVFLAWMPGSSFEFFLVYTILGMLMVRVDLNRWWAAQQTLGRIRADQVKIGEIWDRYYEHFGEMLDPGESHPRRV